MITGPSTEAKRDPTYQKQYDSIKTTNTTSSTSKASGNGSVYQIGSENGYNLAQSLKSNPGSAQTASDGSVWKSDSSGNIWVTKDGVTTKASITYKGSESSGAAGGSGVKASLEDRGNTLLSLMQQAMSGEKNYGLSFQSSANQKISDAYEQRKQSLIEQATKNGYYTSSDAKPGNTATQQAIRNAANQKIETALASGRTAEHARQAEQTRLKTQAQKVAQANEKAQEQGKARTVAEIDKKLEELDREYLGYATNPGSESADELKKQRKELKKQRKELTGEQNVFERIGKAVFGGAAQSLGSSMDAMGTLYQAGQGARNTISAGNLEWYQHQLETEQAALRSMLAENTERPGTYSQKAIQAQAKLVSVAQARVDAFQPGKEERAQEQGGEAARQMAEAVTNYGAILNAQAKKGEGKLGQITLDALSSTTQSAIDAAANMLLGTPGSMLPFAFRAFGGGTQEARNGGGTLGQQIAYGTATAAKEVFTEKLFSIAGLQSEAYGKGSLDDYVEKAISGAVDKLAKTEAGKNIIGGGLTLFANGGGEGLEELIGGWIDWQLPRIYGGETASAKQTLEDSFYDFLVGAVSGVLGSTTDAKVQNYTTARETARLVDPTASATDQAILDAINGVQTPENVTKTRQATAMDNAISEAIMQGQSGITPDVATNKPKDVKNLLNATKEQITRYIQNAFNKQNQYKYLKISDVSPELAATLKTAGIDVDGYAHALRDNDLRHVDKSHGSQSNDKYKVTSEVLEQAQNIIDNYDALYRGYDTKAGNPTVVYEKRMGNRTFYVEEVLEDGLLGTKQMLITGEDSKPSFLKKMTKIASTSTDTSVPTQSGTTGQSPPGKHVQDAESSADYNQNVASTAGTVNTQNQESRNSVQGDNAAGNVSDVLNNAREQYGTIPAGEKAVREVSLPQSVNGRRKVSRFARTAAEAQVTTDEMVGRIEQMVADGKLDHSVYSNKQALSDGAKQIEHEYARGKSIEQIRSEFIRDANNGKAGAKLVSQGTTLYADAIAEGNYQAASDILVALTAVETNAGRTVQAARLMKSMTPEGRIFTVQKMVSNLEGQINQRRSANNQLELNVPDALLEAYRNATTQDAQQAALDSIYDYIAAEIPATLREGLQQWRYFSMLASPSTHLKNIMGNVSGAVAKIGKDSLAALGETLIIGDKEGRTKAFLNPMSKADRNLLNLSWADYSNAADLFEDSTGKYSQAAGEINDRRRYWKINDPQNALTRGMDKALGGLEKVSDFNSKALEVEDMWFSKPMYSVALAGYMKANHLTEITDAARTYAMTEAKRGTYNDINKVSKWATEIGSNSKLGRFLAGTIYPFKKVPANVMVRTLEYSPLGYLKGIYDIANMKGNPDITVAQALDDFAAATTGTALLGIGALLAKHGILRATGVGDEEEKEQQKNAFGAKDMSILVGDDYIPIDSLTLTGTGLLTGAQIWEAAQNSKNGDTPISLDDFLDALSKITDPVFEQSMLSGLDSILSTLQNSAGAGDGETATKIGIQILGNYIGQYVPSFVGRVASSLDKNQRSTYTEPNGAWAPIQSAVQGVQQKIPGLRENMAVRYGNWGVPVEGNGANGVGKAIFNAVTPVYPSTQKTDPVEEEIARLHDVNAEYSNFYKKPKKSIAVGGETVKLTSEQYARYVETHGQTDYSIRAAMLESDLYQNVSDKVKSEAMTLSEQYANALGKEAAGVGYESDDEWINELNGKTEKEIANALVAKAVKLNGYLSEESQKKLDTVKNLYDSGAYMGVSSDLIDSAKEKAEEYFKEAEQAKYGGELSEEKQALEGKNQKTLAEYFLEQAANAKFEDTNDDGTRMDEILDAYQDGDISEKLAMSMLGNQVVDAYADFGKDAGVTAEMVLQTANAYARMKTKKDIDDVVTLSVEAQLDDWLDKQNWTDKQKEALRLGYYTNRADSYNKLVEELENGSITVGEAKKSLTSKYQSAWTHKVSQTGTEMQDYISALAAYENAPSEAERDAMGFDSKWAWYCNELNKTDLTAEQKFAIVNATDNYAEKTQKKIAQALKATYVPTDSGGAGNSGGSYGSGGSSGSSSWISADDEQTQAEKAYERFGKDAGVTESMMQQAKDAKKEMYEIVDMDGNTVRSTEDQFDAWLAKQDWTAEQKEAVKAGFYTDAVKNLTWLSTNLRAGNISVAEAKFELSPTAQTGWSKNVLESGASMADYIDGLITFKQAPKEDERTALGYSTKWAWFCDYLNTTDLTAEQKYAVAISMSSTYADSTKKKIAKAVGWTGKKEDAATSKTSKTTTTSGTSDAFWDELARRLGSALISNESAQTTQTNTNEASQTGDFWKELERRLGSVLISSESTQATQPEETYQIRTNEGYRQYLNILAGKEDEYTASDGTVWTRGEDGEIYATKNGKRMRAEAVFDRADSTDGIDNEPEDGYTVNTPAGKLAYEMLKNGVLTQWDASDGWTWKRTEDGVIAVKKNMRLPVRLAG